MSENNSLFQSVMFYLCIFPILFLKINRNDTLFQIVMFYLCIFQVIFVQLCINVGFYQSMTLNAHVQGRRCLFIVKSNPRIRGLF